MGLVAVSAGVTGGGGSVLDTLTTVGPAIGSIFVAFALIYLFAYLNLLDAAEVNRPVIRDTLVAAIVPLFIAFGGILFYSSLKFV